MRRAALLAALALCLGCGDEPVPARTLGARLVRTSSLSTSPFNAFACTTCHSTDRPPEIGVALRGDERHAGPIMPGASLVDVVHRPSWWGGYMTRLLDAINYCLTEFMGGAALAPEDERARQIYEYLLSLSPTDPAPALALTVVKNITSLTERMGDAARGADLYARACKVCHGAPHTGSGKLGSKTSIIPEDTLQAFPQNARLVVIEKVRHGKFFNIGGTMPLFSAEVLSDAELADILTYLGL